MADTTLPGLLATGAHASRPAASAVGSGGLYSCTDHNLVYQTDGSSWTTWATLSAGGIADQGAFTYLDATEAAAPSTPASGKVRFYAKSDGLLYSKDDAGTETALGGGSGGAPTTAKYVTTAADGTLSNEIVIPSLALADRVAGGANDDEFDTTDTSDPMTGWTTLGSPTHDINSTAASHYYVSSTAASVALQGIYKAKSPAFTVTCKLTEFSYKTGTPFRFGLFIAEATPGKLESIGQDNGNVTVDVWNSRTSYNSSLSGGWALSRRHGPLYFRIVVASSTDVTYQLSFNGLMWHNHGTAVNRNPGFTVGSVGLFINPDTAGAAALFDWIRFT